MNAIEAVESLEKKVAALRRLLHRPELKDAWVCVHSLQADESGMPSVTFYEVADAFAACGRDGWVTVGDNLQRDHEGIVVSIYKAAPLARAFGYEGGAK